MTTVTETIRRYSAELDGDWAVFAKIARYFAYQVAADDREDFLQDLLVEMVKVKEKYDAQEKTLTEAGLKWVARYEVLRYWRKRRYRLFGLYCDNCTSEQRRECHTTSLPSECPKGKARRPLSLDKPVKNDDGDKVTELNELLADNKSIDPGSRLDARRILQGLPKRLVKAGYKVYAGIPLETKEKEYLKHWRKAHPAPFVWERNHLDQRVLELLRKNPQGLTRSHLSKRLNVYVRELNLLCLNQLIKKQQVTAVKRDNTRGRPLSSLLFIAGAEIPGQSDATKYLNPRRRQRRSPLQQKNVKIERDERIRQAYFIKAWSIKRINRELHHCKRTIRRALRDS